MQQYSLLLIRISILTCSILRIRKRDDFRYCDAAFLKYRYYDRRMFHYSVSLSNDYTHKQREIREIYQNLITSKRKERLRRISPPTLHGWSHFRICSWKNCTAGGWREQRIGWVKGERQREKWRREVYGSWMRKQGVQESVRSTDKKKMWMGE